MSSQDFPDEHPTRSNELLSALMARPDCGVLVELIALRGQGWDNKGLDNHFTKQRVTNETDRTSDVDQKWLNVMCTSMRQMNKIMKFVRTSRFLDIGCCPGGYSTYILQKCPTATGVGISLPFSQGGHGLAIPSNLLPRMQIHMADMTCFNLAPPIPQPNLAPIPFTPHTFDLVVCDGHHLRMNPDNDNRPWNWTRLLISQLLLGLRAVSPGGTLFIKLSHIEKPLGARVLLALCRISRLVRAIKPRPVHAIRGTFYAIAQHIQVDSDEFRELVDTLEKLWYTMSFEGENGYGRPMTLEEEDYITSWDDLMSEEGQANIVRLGVRIWEIQRDALRKFLSSRGVSVTLT
ncbi:FtsJ-like methyltransferase [Ceratobasidium sp. AG-Ba]|nr:FtsJ-like methyltransferase [Ceratobasidium sp. AG-Ba]QRW10856.1 FtsJ-like methyltransferase [Ceratobasidium sp. AG-Ba]